MPRSFTPKVVSANRLLDGDAVWLTEDDRWSPDFTEAELIDDEAHADIRLLFGKGQPLAVVGVELVDAARAPDGRPAPTHFREAFRTHGPTNYPHGKQAQGLPTRGHIPGELERRTEHV